MFVNVRGIDAPEQGIRLSWVSINEIKAVTAFTEVRDCHRSIFARQPPGRGRDRDRNRVRRKEVDGYDL